MEKRREGVYLIGALILTLLTATLTTTAWQNHSRKKQLTKELTATIRLLTAKRPREALAELRQIASYAQEKRREERTALEILAHLQMRNIPRLLHLYDRFPRLFLKNEEAALFVCRALLQMKTMEPFEVLRRSWKERETNRAAWFALDVDTHIVKGERELALKKLTSEKYEGEIETTRLTRLALLTAPDNLEEAWGYLEEASLQAPYNSDLRLFRGQILEQLKKPASARVEYVAAHLADPDNPRLRDQLAEFYRRQGNPYLSLITWSEGLTHSAPGYLWLKAMFWSRMVKPLERDWSKELYPEGPLTPLLTYLGKLNDTTPWNDKAFLQLPGGKLFLSTRQELFWLRVVDHLSRGEESQTRVLLTRNPFKENSWHPEMEEALVALLRFRKWGTFPETRESHLSVAKSSHPLFRQLAASGATPPPELQALMMGPEAFSAFFLAGGWLEAALSLHRMPKIPETYPEWVSYGLTQAYRYNRGADEAITFAEKQIQTPAMIVLRGELLISKSQVTEGLSLLNEIAINNSDAGFRAAWLKSMVQLDQGEIGASRQTVRNQPRLADSLTGRELLARMAVAENKTGEATRLYASMAEESTEAKVWLARQAYVEHRWDDARRLTIELGTLYPDTLQFRANLGAITRAEKEESP